MKLARRTPCLPHGSRVELNHSAGLRSVISSTSGRSHSNTARVSSRLRARVNKATLSTNSLRRATRIYQLNWRTLLSQQVSSELAQQSGVEPLDTADYVSRGGRICHHGSSHRDKAQVPRRYAESIEPAGLS